MGNSYTGSEVRKYIVDHGVLLWKVAEKFGLTDSNFSRKLRHSFTNEEYQKIICAVEELKEEE